jgi:hypothetical protein
MSCGRRRKMYKFSYRYGCWKEWYKRSLNHPLYKIAVLFGLRNSPTFDIDLAFNYTPPEKKKRKYDWRLIVGVGIMMALTIVLSTSIFIIPMVHEAKAKKEEPVKDFVDIQPDAILSEPEVKEEPVVVVAEVEEIKPEPVETTRYFDVPLSKDLQDHIFTECEKRNVDPAIIMAMIERESDFRASCVGDGGDSLGLMQIQPRWHQKRANKLGCPDLTDPYQNVTVGIDLFSTLYAKNESLEWALMAYNGGSSYANKKVAAGVVTDYAKTVIRNSKVLEKGRV